MMYDGLMSGFKSMLEKHGFIEISSGKIAIYLDSADRTATVFERHGRVMVKLDDPIYESRTFMRVESFSDYMNRMIVHEAMNV